MKLARERLKLIIKEELEEVRGWGSDPYGRINTRPYKPPTQGGSDEGPKAPSVPQLTKPGRKPDKYGSTSIPASERMPLKTALSDVASKVGGENEGKIVSLMNLVGSLETGDTSLLKHFTKQLEPDGAKAILNLVPDSALRDKVLKLLMDKGIIQNETPSIAQENKKLTRDKLKQIIKEELEEILGQQLTQSPPKEEIGKVRVGYLESKLRELMRKSKKDKTYLEDNVKNELIALNTEFKARNLSPDTTIDLVKSKDEFGRQAGKMFDKNWSNELLRELGLAPDERYTPFNYTP